MLFEGALNGIVPSGMAKERNVTHALEERQNSLDFTDLDSVRESAIRLQRDKQLVAATRAAGFFGQIEKLWTLAREEGGLELLKALALFFRIAAVAKHTRPQFEDLTAQVVNAPSVKPQTLPDSDDRRYLGEALVFASGPWKANYLAEAAVEEVSGEDARDQFVAALMGSVETLSECLLALQYQFETWDVGTQDVGTSRARRLSRVVSSLKKTVIAQDPSIGAALGTALLNFSRAAVAGENISDTNARVQAADSILDFISTVVRFHFSIASDVETYAVVAFVRRWFVTDNPPKELEGVLNTVGGQVLEALVFLAKQGVPNDQLRKTLQLVVGEARATAELRLIGRDMAGIPDDLRQWFLVGTRPAASLSTKDAVDETILRTVDKDIASLFRDAYDLVSIMDRIQDDLPASMAVYEPKLVPAVDRLSECIRRVAQRINMLAARRQMRFNGTIGEWVDFNPVDHELPLETLKGRIAKIKLPSVVRGAEGAAPIVVLKAEVEGDG